VTEVRHPRHELDETFTNSVRFSVMAALVHVERAEFAAVRDAVEITSPALSKQVALLEGTGYVVVGKGRVGRQARTWLQATPAGRQAFARHMAALRAIAAPPD
jgi:DNA-binding MarR family transcriptional regulator